MQDVKRPLIAVTLGTEDAQAPFERIPDYFAALGWAGLDWLILSPADRAKLPEAILQVTGLLLTGGGDVAPVSYKQQPHAGLGGVDEARDALELDAASLAREAGLPILGICRGIQVLNVLYGGTLVQDIANDVPGAQNHRQTARQEGVHWAQLCGAGPVMQAYGSSPERRAWVNSRHHQAIDTLGDGLEVVARADDGIVEAVQGTDGCWITGVQWHPENMVGVDHCAQALFETFAAQCRAKDNAKER